MTAAGSSPEDALVLGALTGFGVMLLGVSYLRARSTRDASVIPYVAAMVAVIALAALAVAGPPALLGLLAMTLNVVVATWALRLIVRRGVATTPQRVLAGAILVMAGVAALLILLLQFRS